MLLKPHLNEGCAQRIDESKEVTGLGSGGGEGLRLRAEQSFATVASTPRHSSSNVSILLS